MYLQHFGFTKMPFGLTPDTEFFVDLEQHHDVLDVLTMALNSGEGFIKISAEVGSGKTLLCRKILQQAAEHWQLAYIPDPCLTPLELKWALALELGLKFSSNIEPGQLLPLLQRQLVSLAAQGKQPIVLIDEAQALPDDTLEALRLLTNLETEKRKLLQVVLFGQPELDKRLYSYRFRQLQQRITFSCRLALLTRSQVRGYVNHRTRLAGTEKPLFSRLAINGLYKYSRGIPRLVNILAHKGLLLAYGEGKARVGLSHIWQAARDTDNVKQASLWWYGLVTSIFLAAYVLFAFYDGLIT